jgi:Carboxypeptidase regulatory-like domain
VSFSFFFFLTTPAKGNLSIANSKNTISHPQTLTPSRPSLLRGSIPPHDPPKDTEKFRVFPVGLNAGKVNINESVLVKGYEDGTQAIDFPNWLLPYDAVIQALKLNVSTLPDGQLEVRSPGIVTRIEAKKLRTDSQLGLVFTVQDLQTLFGVKAEFDIKEYAIKIDIPWLNQSNQQFEEAATPIQFAGLPRFKPANFSLAAVEQKVYATGSENISPSYRGDFTSVGTIFGGSWFLRTEQPQLQDTKTWSISEAQFLRQTKQADYVLGSQPTFWQSQNPGEFWGFTFINRQGFTPPQTFGGFYDPGQRLQAASIGRTISGKAEPGTLVRLVTSFGERIIAEVLVDSSGIYRFNNIKNDSQFITSSNYRVLLYPQGRLTAQPEIRETNYFTVVGQIPAGTSAFVISGGLRRELANESIFGNFSEFRGGLQGRFGLSETLTVGLGGIYDESVRGMAELFYRPQNIPLQVAVSALSGDEWTWNADIRYDPSSNLSAVFTSDRFSNRFNIDWRVSSEFGLFANTDTTDATALGIQLNFSGKNNFTFARVSLDTENRFRWNLLNRWQKLELNQRGNEIGTRSEISYNLSKNKFFDSGSSLLLSYDTLNQNRFDSLLTLGWRYRSQQRAVDGNYLWETQLGYGIGSQGSGAIASLSTTVLPGIMLRGRYQGISTTSEEASFNIDLVSSLGLQGGINSGDRKSDYFRTQGGLLIQPFFDNNNNGKRDNNEKTYTENSDSFVVINKRNLKSYQPNVSNDRILVRLPPDTYHLSLDPSGYPTDWQVSSDAMAVEVVAGSYTAIAIPLIPSYTRSGVITDSQGNAVAGARVEAIEVVKRKSRFSVTNGAGVYFLEGLQQGEYQLEINGKSVDSLKLEENSAAFQELNLKF